MSSGGLMVEPSSGCGWDYAVIRNRLTVERLASYLAAAGQDIERAFHLYEWNIRASAGVLTTAAMVEVVVGNAMDDQLRRWAGHRHAGRSWFDVVPLDKRGQADLARERATRRGRDVEVHGRVIAELSLGFWRYLVASRYLTSLWIPALHAAFQRGGADLRRRRSDVEDLLQRLAFVRNRAAHHEPIHRRDLNLDLASAVELTALICPDAASWVAAKSPLGQLAQDRP